MAGAALQRHCGRVGAIEVGTVAYDGGNRLWTWWSPLAEDAWGWAGTAEGAQKALELWLEAWLENFRPFFDKR